MNVLVYSGPGATVESIKCCTDTLRQLLSPHYCIMNVTASVICNEPWASSTALLAIPGGADLPYCKDLDGKGTEAIERFVRRGGRYIGFCAGAYFASGRCEFELNSSLEVIGSRKLKFFPGTCRGAAYPGFDYNTDSGAVAATVSLNPSLGLKKQTLKTYFNGGGCFVDAKSYSDIQVLAEYEEDIQVDGGDGRAAVVQCKVGKGNAVLMGIHPEFSSVAITSTGKKHHVLKLLEAHEEDRLGFMRACLERIGLKVGQGAKPPRISRLNLSSLHPDRLPYLVEQLKLDENNQFIGSNDTFQFHNGEKSATGEITEDDGVKQVDVFYTGLPTHRYTPYFNHDLYYSVLREEIEHQCGEMGSTILYGEVVTSTSTMLDKNFQLLKILPQGFAAVGTVQVEGRGRGNNAWVNPQGVLAVSTVLRVPIQSGKEFPLVFVQYLVSLAMVEAICGYEGAKYQSIPVKLKWPNDIYAKFPNTDQYIKIGGVLINTNVVDGEFVLVFGLGVNVSNAAPSTSLNLIVDEMNKQNGTKLEHYRVESLLAKFMARFERMYTTFGYTGFREFENLYYKRWLHQDQIVTLEQHGNVKAQIAGISSNAGLLVAHEVEQDPVTGQYTKTGQRFELQPDGNSFDMLRGLLKRKS